MNAAEQLIASEGDTLDALLWRERGMGPEDLGPVLDLNPGTAAIGAVLPAGTVIQVPPAPSSSAPLLPLLQLWD